MTPVQNLWHQAVGPVRQKKTAPEPPPAGESNDPAPGPRDQSSAGGRTGVWRRKQRAAGQEKPDEQNAFPGGDESVCQQSSFLIPHSSTATATVANNRRQQNPAEASVPPSGEANGEVNPNVAAESVALGRMSLK
ncbi:hypothetical protein E5D57_012418 [Metarhizium anisopliae]|nr:hypothetical protein E5D57_012418 [Metarhizium anisopliae]